MAAVSYRPMANPNESPRRLRFGVMCNGRRFPAWQAEAIRRLLDVPDIEVGLLIVRDAPLGAAGKLSRLRDWRHILWTMLNKGFIERRSRASRSVDLSERLEGVPEIVCHTEPVGEFGEKFSDADIATIREHALDFILRFSFGIIKGEILDVPRYGVWSFHHGDEREYRGRPPGFWELVDDKPTVGAILQRLTERLDGGVVLHRGSFRATPHSYRRTRDDAFLGSAVWPSIAARMIQNGDTSLAEAEPSTTDAPVKRDPANATMAAFLVQQAARFAVNQVRGIARTAVWSVGVADVPIESFLDGEPAIFAWMAEQGRGRYLADPFGYEHDGELVLLVEDYRYDIHRGVISAIDVNGRSAKARTVLDPGVHASYPYLFEHDGNVYCVPETYQANEVRLYRADPFPERWELVTTLVSGLAALDPTVLQHDGRWWLFCTDHADGPNTKLHVWHADELEGPWQPHALNPVKTDVRSARPAGTPFTHDAGLYRPAQDGSSSYGGGVAINRIDELTPTTFRETVVATVRPPATGRYRDGIHTLSAVGDRTVADGRRDTFVLAAFRRELGSRIRKLGRG